MVRVEMHESTTATIQPATTNKSTMPLKIKRRSKGRPPVAWLFAIALLTRSSAIFADEVEVENEGVTENVSKGADEKATHPKAVDDPAPRFRLTGRVFAGHTTSRREIADQAVWRSGYVLNSARIGLKYEKGDFLKAEVELEAASGDTEVRDAYLNLEPGAGVELQAGRFKRPLSVFSLASRWDLPVIERGLLATEVDGRELDIVGGRGGGFLISYRAPLAIPAEVSLSAFESAGTEGLIDANKSMSQDFYLRAFAEPHKDLHIASTVALIGYYKEAGQPTTYAHAPLVSLEFAYSGHYLRAWVEGFSGRNHFSRVGDPASGTFGAGRVFIAPRFRTGTPRRLVPYLGASHFDPEVGQAGNSSTEFQGGINLAFTKTWRLQFEAAHLVKEGMSAFALPSSVFRIQLAAKYSQE